MKYFLISLFILLNGIQKHQLESNDMDLGVFSMSLSVKDIKKSKEFYEKLGFNQLENAGSIKDKWLIMKNGSIKVGLFQGMFPQNTLTFNPKDARAIHDQLAKDPSFKTLFSRGIDKDIGPASFSFLDPDGNPILIDQHQ